jgi:protein-S-isoprenylcysteine O-methyltransferase Ste14
MNHAGASEPSSGRSPWWYRWRGTIIGLVYALGFFLGYAVRGAHPPHPAFIVLGDRFANGEGRVLLLWFAVACALVAWFWRAWGTAYLRRNVVFAADAQSDRLIVAGPFRYVRNPLYLGNMFLALAIGLLAPPLGFAIVLVGNAVVVAFLAAEESRQLAARYGAVYDAFRAAVPAFLPRLTPASVPGSVAVEPSWRAGLLTESFCFAAAVAIALTGVRR